MPCYLLFFKKIILAFNCMSDMFYGIIHLSKLYFYLLFSDSFVSLSEYTEFTPVGFIPIVFLIRSFLILLF